MTTKEQHGQSTPRTAAAIAAAIALVLASQQPVRADAIDNLLERLKEKGVITTDEYNELKDVREGEKAVARQRRKEANEEMTKKEEIAKTGVQGYFRDGIVFESADKKTSLSVNGRIQLDYRNFSGEDAIGADTFDIRRAYLGAAGKFWDYYTFDVTADFGALSNNSHLDVAWLNAAWWQPFQLRFGQFKMPFSIEELTSSRFIDFQERSFVNAFVPAKERGIMAHGSPAKGVFYGVAVSTGQGKNNNELNNIVDSNDTIARVGANLAEIIGHPSNVYHLALGYTTGEIPVGATPSLRTEARGQTFFSTAAFTGTDTERERKIVEGSLAIGPVKLQGEYAQVNFSGTSAGGVGYDKDIDTWYASVNWLITGEKYADAYRNGAYGRIKPKSNFKPGGGGKGAWELGLRYSNFDGSDFPILAAGAANPGTGAVIPTLASGVLTQPTNEAKAYTLGVKWLPTPNTRFLLNYVKTEYETPVVAVNTPGNVATNDEKAITLRAQFDF